MRAIQSDCWPATGAFEYDLLSGAITPAYRGTAGDPAMDIVRKPVTAAGRCSRMRFVTTPLNPLVDDWGARPRRLRGTHHVLSRRDARRMSRSFARVGVAILPARLRQIAAGGAVPSGELAELKFALIVTQIQRERRHTKFERGRRRLLWWLLIVGLALVALNALISIEYLLFSISQQSPAY
jgi:hypothetical protein